MNTKELRSLIKMITETDITEFELEEGEKKIVIRRFSTPGGKTVASGPAFIPPPISQALVMPPVPTGAMESSEALKEESAERLEEIKSPIVGTFYRAPSPDSEPYVEVGTIIEKGQILCIVEAMKLMNEIEADFKCRIREIIKENSQPVEYGEVLFLVERL